MKIPSTATAWPCFVLSNSGRASARTICRRASHPSDRWLLYPHREGELRMARRVAYWLSTALLVAGAIAGGVTYLSGSHDAVEGFAHVGYPQQLRVILGVAKLAGAAVLVAPRLPL